MAGVMLETQLALMPLLNVKAATEAIQVVEKGPVTCAPLDYPADSWSDTTLLFQNIVPASTRLAIQRNFMLSCSFLVGYSIGGTPATLARGATPLMGGVDVMDAGPPLPAPWQIEYDRCVDEPIAIVGLNTAVYGIRMRSLPFNSIVSNIDLKINGQATSFQGNELADLWPYITEPSGNRRYLSTTPFYQSAACTSSSMAVNDTTFANRASDMPGGSVESLRPQHACTSIRIVGVQGTAGGDTTEGLNLVYQVDVQEPIIIPPLRYGETYDEAGLSRVMSFMVNLTLNNLLRAIVVNTNLPISPAGAVADGSIANLTVSLGSNGITIPGFTAAGGNVVAPLTLGKITSPPKLTLLYAQPDAMTERGDPQFPIYECDLIQQWQSPVTEISLTAAVVNVAIQTGKWSATSSTIRLPSIPSTLFIYAKPSMSARQANVPRAATDPPNGYNLADTYLHITKCTINFMDRVGMFSTYDEVGLYRMSVKNGYRGSYRRWKYLSGSVLIVNISEDLCLAPREAPGQSVYSTMQVTVEGDYSVQRFTLAPTALGGTSVCQIEHTLYVATSIPGKAIIGGGQAQFLTEGPSSGQVYSLLAGPGTKLQSNDFNTTDDGGAGGPKGGSFFSKMKHLARKGLSRGVSFLSDHPEILSGAMGALSNLIPQDDGPAADGDGEGGAMVAGRFHKRTRA